MFIFSTKLFKLRYFYWPREKKPSGAIVRSSNTNLQSKFTPVSIKLAGVFCCPCHCSRFDRLISIARGPAPGSPDCLASTDIIPQLKQALEAGKVAAWPFHHFNATAPSKWAGTLTWEVLSTFPILFSFLIKTRIKQLWIKFMYGKKYTILTNITSN